MNVLHVMVVGFDHKKGCQIEYCYPPLNESFEPKLEDIPPAWTNLPSLAIPDLAHNVVEDIIYFLLPSLESPNRAVFGMSCYRQIATNDLVTKDDQFTRSHVQKSVVVLMRLPLYGFLKEKLELITQTYFNERDFSKVGVLHQMYTNLCDMFTSDFNDFNVQSATIGISLSTLVSMFRHRILILFKLLLLEKRVMFEIFPVNILDNVMMGLISLFPALMEEGLFEAADYSVRQFHPKQDLKQMEESSDRNVNSDSQASTKKTSISIGKNQIEDNAAITENESKETSNNLSSLNTDEYGFPLSIFTKGSLFHPYLSINQIELISSDNTRAYCIGVSNAIFKERRKFIDVIISINDQKEAQIEILNTELKQQLALSMQDLRFMDFVLKQYDQNNDSTFWEGSDEWVRSQFHTYLTLLLATAKSGESNKISEFNELYVNALKTTHNYRVWSSQEHSGLAQISPMHMFSGQFSGNDLLLKLGHSESGRKMISTLTNTGKLMSQTSNRLKSSISSWIQRSDQTSTNSISPAN